MKAPKKSTGTTGERAREWGAIALSLVALLVSGLAFVQQGRADERAEFNGLKDDLQQAFATIFEGVGAGEIEADVWIQEQWTRYVDVGDEASEKGVSELQGTLEVIRAECSPLVNQSCPSMINPSIFDETGPLAVFVPDTEDRGDSFSLRDWP